MARRILRRFEGIIRDVIWGSPLRENIIIPVLGPEASPSTTDVLQLETGDVFLLETGDFFLLEG